MSFEWIHETPAVWDVKKRAIVGAAPAGIFDVGRYADGDLIPGEWWRVEENGSPVGYGWMDTIWGDAEILLVVDSQRQGRGAGTFILENLEREARARGLNYLYNVVPAGHPDPERLAAWLQGRGFAPGDEGRLVRHVPAS